MPYLNTRLHALLAMGLLLLAAPALHAQEASVVATEIRGDVNGDGQVTAADAEAVRAYLVRGTVPQGRSILPAGDANADGRVTAADAALISRFVAGVDVSRFPVGRRVGDERIETTDISRMQLALYSCSTSVSTRMTSCQRAVPGGDAAMFDIIVGDEGVDVTSSDVSVSNGNSANTDTTTMTWTLTNRMDQPIGTTDGINPAPTGSRLFFYSGPTATSLTPGSRAAKYYPITPVGAPSSNFARTHGPTYTNKKYYQFDGVIQKDASVARQVSFVYSPNVLAFTYELLLATPVQFDTGRIVIAPAAPTVVGAGQPTQLTATVYNYLAQTEGTAVTWSSSDDNIATVSPTGLVTGVAGGTVTITASTVSPVRVATRVVQVIQANPDALTTATGNVRINSAQTSPVLTVTENDTLHGAEITFAGWGTTEDKTLNGGDVDLDPTTGTFTYNPPAGFEGTDSLMYVIEVTAANGVAVDTGRVALPVSQMIWFVGTGGATPCVPNAPNASDVCGRLTAPYPSLAEFQADNNGSVPLTNPKAGDAIFLYEGAHAGSVTLLASQLLVGQDATGATFESITGIDPAQGSDALPPMNPTGTLVTITGGPAGGVILAANNLVRGFDLVTSAGAALSGSNFGTPTISQVNIAATNGPAISLDNGTLTSTFTTATSTSSTGRGISLTNVNGALTFNPGSISGAAQSAFFVSGGDVDVTWSGTLSQANNAPLVDVQSSHNGTLAFSGTLGATNGAGLQFNAAQGIYNFSGTTTLGGNDAGIDITNGSAGTFTFGAGTAITNLTGTGVNVYGSAATVTYSGSITKDGTSQGRLVEVGEQTAGTVTFTGTLSANSTNSLSTGISLSNADGTVNFNGTTTLNGGDAGVDILSASAGTFTFNANTLIQNPTGTAFNVNGSTPNITYNGSIIRTANNALLVDLSTVGSGTITFDPAAGTDSLYATIGDGIQLSNADGAVDFNGRVRLAGGNAGVDIINGSSGNIDFDAATIVNPTGEALRIFNGSGGDQATDVSFAGSISTNAGRPVLVEDMSSGSVAVSALIAATGQGILVQNNSGGTVTFSNATQTLNTAGNAAVTLASNTGATVNFTGGGLALTTAAGAGLNATGGGTLNVTGASNTISSGTGTALNVQNTTIGASGLTFRSIAAAGAANGIVLNNTGSTNGLVVTGTGSAGSGGTITGTTGDAVSLTSARGVRLTSMNIQNSGGSGIYGSSVTNFSLKSSTVSANGNAVGEAGLEFDNLLGTDSVVNSTITGSAEDNLVVRNNTGVLDSLVVTGNTISSNSSIGSDGILVTASNTANATVRVRNNTLTANKGDHFQATASNSALLNVVLFQNTMTGGHPTALGQGVTLGTGLTFTGTFTYDLNDNDILNGPISNAITIDHDGTTGSLMQGRVRNNVIGTSGVDLSCSAQASGIEIENGNRGTHTYAVTGNTVRRCYDRGIFLDNGDGANVVVNATVTGNTVNELTTANARQALYVNVGSFDPNFLGVPDSFTVCADIQGNTLTSNPAFSSEAIRLRMRFNSRMNLPGYAGSFNNAANEVNAYLAARNTLTVSATATTTAAGAPYGYYNIASCPTPP